MGKRESISWNPTDPQDVGRVVTVLFEQLDGISTQLEALGRVQLALMATLAGNRPQPFVAKSDIDQALSILVGLEDDGDPATPVTAKWASSLRSALRGEFNHDPGAASTRPHLMIVRTDTPGTE